MCGDLRIPVEGIADGIAAGEAPVIRRGLIERGLERVGEASQVGAAVGEMRPQVAEALLGVLSVDQRRLALWRRGLAPRRRGAHHCCALFLFVFLVSFGRERDLGGN